MYCMYCVYFVYHVYCMYCVYCVYCVYCMYCVCHVYTVVSLPYADLSALAHSVFLVLLGLEQYSSLSHTMSSYGD